MKTFRKIIIYLAIFGVAYWVAYWATGFYDKKLLEKDPIGEFLVITGLFSFLPSLAKRAGDKHVISLRSNFLKRRIPLVRISRVSALAIAITALAWVVNKFINNDCTNRVVWSLVTIIFVGYIPTSLVLLVIFSKKATRISDKTSNK